ncbi:MAG: hypothetical protein HYZ53_30245 [Planctomycetes bacterium]|nr:hypothetical protein [Planctomycetota bacterium]
MGKQRKHGDPVRLPVRHPSGSPSNPERSTAGPPGKERDHPVGSKLVEALRGRIHGEGVDRGAAQVRRAVLAELRKTGVSKESLADLHPAHAPYVFAQNRVSILSEQITTLDEMAEFAELVTRAEDLYGTGGPPCSPLTSSYFVSWAFFDACVGAGRETLGTCMLELGAAFGMDDELLRLVRMLQDARMGLYVHEGCAGNLVSLREVVTGAACRALVPAGYSGRAGELWYVRVLPPPAPGIVEHLVFTTPYVLLQPGLAEWEAYFHRTLPAAPPQARLDAYESHLKYGPSRTYWNDFVFEGYVNHQREVIFLAGLPDVPESRPHSDVNRSRFQR